MILATWAILFGQLLNRDYFVKTLDIRETKAIQRGREETFMGIYFKQERIGYVKNRMVKKDEQKHRKINQGNDPGHLGHLIWSITEQGLFR